MRDAGEKEPSWLALRRLELNAEEIGSESNLSAEHVRGLVRRAKNLSARAGEKSLRPTRIDELMRSGELSSYAGWALRKAGLADLKDLSGWPRERLNLVHRLGRKGLLEVERAMAAHGLHFGSTA